MGTGNREIYTTGRVTHFFGDNALVIDTEGWSRVTHTHIFICVDPATKVVPPSYRFTFDPDVDDTFNTGDIAVYDGIRTRIEKGNKAPDDFTWNIYADDETRVPFNYVTDAVRAFCAIEDRLYLRSKGKQGYKYFLKRLADARTRGWRYAKQLNDEEIRRLAR